MSSVVGSVVGGLLGGSEGASSGPASVGSYYPNIFQNSQTYQKLLGNNTANTDTLQNIAAPAAVNNYNTASNNPYAAAFQTGAGTAGSAYTGAGNSAIAAGNNLMPQSNQLSGYAQQVMKLGLDPQSTLYKQQLQGTRDSANATNAQYGLTGPWAAGATNQATQNFNTGWQADQLQRALQALNGGGSAIGQAGQIAGQANNLQTTGAGDLYTGTGLPYNTAQGISGNQNLDLNNLISNIGGINNIDSSTMASLLQYLAQGSGYGLKSNAATNNAAASGASGGMDLGGLIGGALSFL